MKINEQIKNIGYGGKSPIRGSHVETLNDLMSLTKNYKNRLVWVIDVKSYYYLNDNLGGGLIGDWIKYTPTFNIVPYDNTKTYTLGEFTLYGAGELYYSLENENINNTPLSSPSNWKPVITQPKFNPVANDVETMQQDFGGILAGTKVGDLRNKEIGTVLYDAMFPLVNAYVSEPKELSQTFGLRTLYLQIGTILDLHFYVTYKPGKITNGNQNFAGDLTNAMTKLWIVNGFNVEVLSNLNPTNPTESLTLDGHVVTPGPTMFNVFCSHGEGVTTYSDSRNVTETHLDSQTMAGDVQTISESIIGVYNWWVYIGQQGSEPLGSYDVKALYKTGNSIQNTEAIYFINPGQTTFVVWSKEFVVRLTNEYTNDVMLPDLSEDFDIITGNTTSVYKKHTFNFGSTGFPEQVKLKMQIIS